MISGSVFCVYLFSHKMEINDIVIGILICSFYIFAAVCYVVTSPFWQTFLRKYSLLINYQLPTVTSIMHKIVKRLSVRPLLYIYNLI